MFKMLILQNLPTKNRQTRVLTNAVYRKQYSISQKYNAD